jgi:cellulose synthase/poly-beta-1,6-N-acetylglucosamine synthase-like glycosyltransferase
MASISNLMFYVLVFLSVYVQVFFLVTFFENRKKIVTRRGEVKLAFYPSVTIVVPAFNEEGSVRRTIESIFNLNYPKDKIKIFLINDGSTDKTGEIMREFEGHLNLKIFEKENGGKYTALNLGLLHMDTEFFGGLDADSFADPEALVRIMSYFEKNKEVMAVAPSIAVHATKNPVQGAQKAEYHMGIFNKKMLHFLGAINVTPGPLTIFRKKVFDDLGVYRHGHNTEDMEIAYRMQKGGYKIEHCNDAYVYTNTPSSLRKLFRQRLRWVYGFINNTIDYRGVLFRKKYGNFALFTLPTGLVSFLAVSYLFGRMLYSLGHFVYVQVLEFRAVGFDFAAKTSGVDLFFMNTRSFVFLVFFIYSLVFFSIIFGRKMIEGKWALSMDMLYFFVIFRLLAPFWFLKAVYNTIVRRKPAWR